MRFLAVFFCGLYILAMVKPVLPLFEYVINKDYIAEFLCINKEEPELNCNGKCYLAKQLKAEKEEKKQNLPAINLKDYPIGFVFVLNLNTDILHIQEKPNFCTPLGFYNAFIPEVFKPPSV